MSNMFRTSRLAVTSAVFATVLACFAGCSKGPEWKAVNDKLIKENDITTRTLSYKTDTGIVSTLGDGQVSSLDSLATVTLAEGVTAKMYWGRGNLIAFVTMQPGAVIPEEALTSERIMVMQEGSVEQLVNGAYVPMTATAVAPAYYYSTGLLGTQDALYLEEGAQNGVKAGANGAKFFEVYAPVRTDYMEKAGATVPATIKPAAMNGTPSVAPNTVINVNEIQYTELTAGAWSKLINGKGAQVSILFMDTDIEFPYHNHPEEQLMTVLRGSIDEWILDGTKTMTAGSILYLPPQMVHGAKLSPQACNAIDVFYPVRTDYQDKTKARMDMYNAIIPAGEKPVLLAEGFKFTEGAAWMDGKLYFSSMFFDIPAGTWALDPKKSDLIAMNPDGTWDYVLKGKLETNGLIAKGNGNLLACDMAGHRIVEIAPDGRIVGDIATHLKEGATKGLRLDGPNDLVMDAKGGIYFTDPQFINDKPVRAGKTVNYMKPNGDVIEIIAPGELGMGNGLEISPDGKKLYVNNTYHDAKRPSDVENWFVSYDINEDGTVSNKTKFGKCFLHPTEYDLGTRSSCADGSAVDELGNIYQATNTGVQIFNNQGVYVGTIFTPTFPVSVCFGGDNMDTLYIVAWDKVYSIKTNVKGFVLTQQAAK